MFVGQHGGQSEIVLRVKQGDNPTFGFLMPHHHLHPYFRYLVDHPEVLKTGNDSKSQGEKSNDVQACGALSLLGSIYGSGEDEDVEAKVEIKSEQTVSGGTASASDVPKSDKSEQALSAGDGAQKDETVSVHSLTSKVKVSAPSIKSITSIKPGRATSIKSYGSIGSNMEMPKASTLFPLAHAEKSLVDPPSEMKKLVDRIVEIILKNGRDFESVLIEQDKKHGKFPFLLPSNQYHPYYIRVLKKAQESRISGKTFGSGKEGSSWQEIEKDAGHQMKESECASLDGSDDLDLDYDKKDKFKMVIPKTKKDPQEQPPKESQQQSRFTVDATAAAAILQAATRGIRNPNLKIFSNKTSHDSSIEGGSSSNSALKENGESSHTARDKDIAKIAAGEADTSDSELMRQQKLKAERLRRAKMFAAMIKSGAAPLGTEPPRCSSLEPPGSGPGKSGLADKNVVEEVKGREGSYPLMESNDENEHKLNKRRHYRSRIHNDGQGEEESKENEEDTGEDDEKSRSTKRHKSRHSSRHHRDRSKDRHKHRRRHSSSKSKESRHRHKHDSSSEDDDDRHHRQKSDSSMEEERKHYKRKHKHENSSEEESKHVKRRHKESSRKHRHRERSGKNDRSHAEEGELEEGEIRTKTSDQSLSAINEDASREASVDASKSPLREKRSSLPPTEPTEVPDELRAKIRAMLLATM